MARYIDADRIRYFFNVSDKTPIEGSDIAYKPQIDNIPTADIVSRADYDKLKSQLAEAMELLNVYQDALNGITTKIATSTFKLSDGDTVGSLHLGRCERCLLNRDDYHDDCKVDGKTNCFIFLHADRYEKLLQEVEHNS